jgi:hypothetical protein
MIIEKNSQGWSFSTDDHKNLWHLLFDDSKNIISYNLESLYTSTQANLFVGTLEECEQYIIDNNLVRPPVIEEVPIPQVIEDAPPIQWDMTEPDTTEPDTTEPVTTEEDATEPVTTEEDIN